MNQKGTAESRFDRPGYITPPHPVLFIAVGELAWQAAKKMADVLDILHLKIDGRFGYVKITPIAERVGCCQASHWLEDSIGVQVDESQPAVSCDSDDFAQNLRTLVRQLQPEQSVFPFTQSIHHSAKVYLLADMRVVECLEVGIQALRLVCQEPVIPDVTGIFLTGRTAHYSKEEKRWREGLATLQRANTVQRANHGSCLLHRAYLVDGKDARESWLQSEQDQARMVAEFLVHHGLSPYHDIFRKNELTRYSTNQPFENVCGSFACRTMHSDSEKIGLIVAEQLERRLFEGSGHLLTPDETIEVEGIAKALGEKLDDIFNRISGRRGEPEASVSELGVADVVRQAKEALRHSLRDIRVDYPLERLQCFFRTVSDKIDELRIQSSVIDRVRTRMEVAVALRDQLGQGRLDARKAPTNVVFLPPGWACAVGISALCLGTLSAWGVLWLQWDPAYFSISLALVLGGALWLDNPSAWATQEPSRNESDMRHDALRIGYRRRIRFDEMVTGLGMAALGVVLIILSSRISTGASVTLFAWLISTMTALTAVLFALLPALDKHTQLVQNGSLEFPDMMLPYPWWRPVSVVAFLGIFSWVMLWWPIEWRSADYFPFIIGFGFFLLALGTGWMAYPRQKEVRLPLSAIVARRRPDGLIREQALENLLQWCKHLMGSSRVLLEASDALRWPEPQAVGTILDAVSTDWEIILANVCASEVEADIHNPHVWADYLLAELEAPRSDCSGLGRVFALRAVESVLSKMSWKEVLEHFETKSGWISRYMNDAVTPLWHLGPQHYDLDNGVVVLDEESWELIGSQDDSGSSRYRLVEVGWPKAGTIVFARIVQGLKSGSLDTGYADGITGGE